MAAKEKVYCGFCSKDISADYKILHYKNVHNIDLLAKACVQCGVMFRAKNIKTESCYECKPLPVTALKPLVSFEPLGCEGCERVERGSFIYWYRDGRVVGVDRVLDVLAVAVLPAYELAYSNGGEEIEERVKGKAGRPKKVFADGVPTQDHPWKMSYLASERR